MKPRQLNRYTTRLPNEDWKSWAVRLSDHGWSSRQIAVEVDKCHTTVLYNLNSEYRRDKKLYEKRKRAERSKEDIRIDNLSRSIRKQLSMKRLPDDPR